MSSTTQYNELVDSAASVSWLNLLGIAVSVVLMITYIVLGAHAMKYLKSFAIKIKIIVNRAEDKTVNTKNFYSDTKQPKSEAYIRGEELLINEVRRSRSPYFLNLFACYMQKYDHMVYYLFRNRTLDKIELLRPKPTFFAMLGVATLCISWICTILLVSLLQQLYTDITKVSLMMYGLFTFLITIFTTGFSLLAINRFFRLYELNIKNAFKIDYGKKFIKLRDGGMNDYEPENS